MFLPPTQNPARLLAEINMVPLADREDVIQEAWVAYLSGQDPLVAVWRVEKRRKRHRARNVRLYPTLHAREDQMRAVRPIARAG